MSMCSYRLNRRLTDDPGWNNPEYEAFLADDLTAFHQSVPGYQSTPLVSLTSLAAQLGVKEVIVKDESHRFGLKAFKAMGASYAIYRFIRREWERQLGVQFELSNLYDPVALGQLNLRPFCTATDGNHGRAVAWFANKIGQRSVIYVPSCTVVARIENIRREAAEVIVVDGGYDETVRQMASDADRQGWHVISDTSYEGYTQVPAWIMAAYTTMFREVDEALTVRGSDELTHVFVQAGVGSFAGAAAWYYFHKPKRPFLLTVEPVEADCVFQSIDGVDGEPKVSQGSQKTIMAGLNCGTISLNAWPLLRDRVDMALAVSDDYSRKAMRQYYYPHGDDSQIIAGESGAAGLGALLALASSANLKDVMAKAGIGPESVILLFNTEGDTDPEHFQSIVASRQ